MSITSTVTYQGELRTTAIHLQSNSRLITDAPIDNHGKGEAFSPTDLVATALASCMLTIMGIKADDLQVDLSGSHADVTKVMSANPRRIAEIHIDIYVTCSLSDKQQKLLEAAAHTCPVSQSLHPETQQIVAFHYEKG